MKIQTEGKIISRNTGIRERVGKHVCVCVKLMRNSFV